MTDPSNPPLLSPHEQERWLSGLIWPLTARPDYTLFDYRCACHKCPGFIPLTLNGERVRYETKGRFGAMEMHDQMLCASHINTAAALKLSPPQFSEYFNAGALRGMCPVPYCVTPLRSTTFNIVINDAPTERVCRRCADTFRAIPTGTVVADIPRLSFSVMMQTLNGLSQNNAIFRRLLDNPQFEGYPKPAAYAIGFCDFVTFWTTVRYATTVKNVVKPSDIRPIEMLPSWQQIEYVPLFWRPEDALSVGLDPYPNIPKED